MRKCRLIIVKDGTEQVVYQGSQETHMQAMLGHYRRQGTEARIECDPPQKRRVRINSITGRVKK